MWGHACLMLGSLKAMPHALCPASEEKPEVATTLDALGWMDGLKQALPYTPTPPSSLA